MRTQIKKWGNSLALRIQKSFALNASPRQNEVVGLSIDKQKIVITPIAEKKYLLDELLECVNENNIHGEFDTGASVGKEIW